MNSVVKKKTRLGDENENLKNKLVDIRITYMQYSFKSRFLCDMNYGLSNYWYLFR